MFSIFSSDLSFYFETDFTYCTYYNGGRFIWNKVDNARLYERGIYGV